MPSNLEAILLILVFIVPGFVCVEVDARLRFGQKLAAFERTIVSILISAALHAVLTWLTLFVLFLLRFNLANLFDRNWLANWFVANPFLAVNLGLFYFAIAIVLAVFVGWKVGPVTKRWVPVISRIVDENKRNSVLIQMKNGDFFTGLLDMIPADYEVLQSPAKDFTIIPPGRYKPKGQAWQNLEDKEVVLLNTSNVDAIRIIEL